MVTVVVPTLILIYGREIDTRWPALSSIHMASRIAGILLVLAGLWLLTGTIRLFATVGKGTLAPWDPTQKLVVAGPYRYVRNPMITGVLTILLGQAFVMGSVALASLALFFLAVNHVYFILSEEPGLVRRFGEDYRRYAQHVPRWLPRLGPWEGP